MKKFISVLLAVSIVLTTLIVLPMSASAEVFGLLAANKIQGDGSEGNPFIVTNEDELKLMDDFNDCCFKLANDIDVTNWVAIGTTTGSFDGSIDGNGHAVRGLNAPFIRTNNGTVKNIILITGNSFYGGGIIAGTNGGTITDCYAAGNVSGNNGSWGVYGYDNRYFFGSAVSYNNSTGIIKNCTVKSTQKYDNYMGYQGQARYFIGGFAGKNAGTISACSVNSSASIRLEGNTFDFPARIYYGGFAGDNTKGKISDCAAISKASIKADNSSTFAYCCGFAGYCTTSASGTVENSYAVNSCEFTGSFNTKVYKGFEYCWSTNNTTVNASYYDKTVSGASDTGYGTPKSTMAMMMKSTYTGAGWDFDSVWDMDGDENINNGYPYLKKAYSETMKENGFIYSVENDEATIVSYEGGGDIVLPEKLGGYPVVAIEDYAFLNCGELTSITVPRGIASIGKNAFLNCDGLTDVYYNGTESDWEGITIASGNDVLNSVTMHYSDITLDKVQAVKLNKNTSATMRFFFTPTYYSGEVTSFGAYIVPLGIFTQSGMSKTALVKKDDAIESGQSYSADLTEIPSTAFDEEMFAMPFIMFGEDAMIVIDTDLYEENTVNNKDINK